MPATVAIVGRPNVGKSTLFNRLARKNAAITHDLPGVTRDRVYAVARLGERRVAVVDTGGLEVFSPGEGSVQSEIFEQAREAVAEANAILLVMDGREGLTPLDEEVAAYVRASNKPVLLAVNKVDGEELEAGALSEFHVLGFPLLAVSGEHGYQLRTLREMIPQELLGDVPEDDAEDQTAEGLRLTMLGRPNAGKSSMVNALIGANRVIVSPEAGTTRDVVDVVFESGSKRYTFVDTAGVRRRTRVQGAIERFSVLRALKASNRAQVTLLVLDATQGVTSQDKKLLALLVKENTPFIVAVNKSDLVPREHLADLKRAVELELRICPHAPVVYTSTVTRSGLGGILPLAEKLWAECQVRMTTGQLNRAMETALSRHQPPMVKGRRAKFFYLTQVDVQPPTFIFFVSNAKLVKDSYARYLENQLRKLVGIRMAPLKVHFRSSHEERYTGKDKRSKGRG